MVILFIWLTGELSCYCSLLDFLLYVAILQRIIMTTRQKAIQIFTAAVNAVQPSQLIPIHLIIEGNTLSVFDQHFLINELPNIYVIGAGKASAAMAKTTEEILK